MTTDEDERALARRLTALADDAPPMQLDVGATVRAGRRRLLGRRVGFGGLVTAAVIGIALVVVRSAWTAPIEPAHPRHQDPRPIGTSQSVEVEPGLQATNWLTDANAVINDKTWQDTGMNVVDDRGSRLSAALIVDSPRTADVNWHGPAPDTAVAIELYGGSYPAAPSTLSWYSRDTPADHGPDSSAQTATMYGFAAGARTGTFALAAGAVPRWLPDPRIVLYVPSGIPTAGGRTTTWVELPTFRSPTADGRLLWSFLADSRTSVDLNMTSWTVLAVGSDGATYTDACPTGVRGCTQRLDSAALAQIATVLSTSPSTSTAAAGMP